MIDSALQAELREKFNPEGSLLRKHQLRMLEMLKYIDSICRDNDISYWLSSGTCLGAVRHSGFIPWDDDTDIEMLRSDYLKLEKILNNDDRYCLQTHESDPYYVAPYAKLRDKHSTISEHTQDSKYKYRGIYIDIFQLEPLPGVVSYITNIINWRILLFGAKTPKILYPIFLLLKHLFYIGVVFLRFICKIFYKKEILRHTYGGGFHNKIRRIEWLLPVSRIDFEGYKFPIPHDVNAYLTSLYGANYMTLPDLTKIHNHITNIEIN